MRPILLVLFISFLFILSLSSNVVCGDCDLEIRDGHGAEDLRKALHCLDERIKDVEIKIVNMESDGRKSNPSVNSLEYDAGTFNVSVHGVSKIDSSIYIGIAIKNKTTENILVTIDNTRPPVLIEASGIPVRYDWYQGMSHVNGNDKNEGSYRQIPANKILSFSLKFIANKDDCRMFNLTLNLMSLKNQHIERISAPLSVTLQK